MAKLDIISPLGPLTIVTAGNALRELHFGHTGPGGSPDDITREVSRQLEEYFRGDRNSFDLSLDPAGSEFEKRVWREVLNIPIGKTTNYGRIAEILGDPLSVRAVGRANGKNPIPVIIPCHRVIGADGSLTGYSGGLDKKKWLLAHEGMEGLDQLDMFSES